MISKSNTITSVLTGVNTVKEGSVSSTISPILAFTSILTSTKLHRWQEDACIAYFKARIRYTALCRYLMHGDDSVTPASSMFFEIRTTYIRRRQDLHTVRVPPEVITELDQFHSKFIETMEQETISMNPLEDSV